MAFATLPSAMIRNSISCPTMAVSDNKSDNTKDGFSFRHKGIFKGQRNNLQHDLTVTNVASPLPVIAPSPPPPPPEETSGRTTPGRHHVAWTSVPQERWEGELVVQGQIPLWLVYILH